MSLPLVQTGGGGSSLATPVSLANGGTHADLSATGGASQVLKQVSTGADVTVAQLAFTDISGTAAAGQLPTPTTTTFGGVKDLAAVSTKFLTSVVSGVPVAAQPAFTDVSGVATSAQGGTLNETTGSVGQCLWVPDGAPLGTTGSGVMDITIHKCRFVMFKVTQQITVTRATVNVATTSNGNYVYLGIYDSTHSSLLAQFTFTLGAGTGVLSTTKVGGGSVSLAPGWYCLVWASESTAPTLTGLSISTALGAVMNSQFTRIGQGAAGSPEAGGVLPANLGTVVAATLNVPIVLLEVS